MKDNEKWAEITIDEYGFKFRHSTPHPLTAEQKHNIVMAILALLLFGLCVILICTATKLCGFPGFLLSLVGVVVLFAVILQNLGY